MGWDGMGEGHGKGLSAQSVLFMICPCTPWSVLEKVHQGRQFASPEEDQGEQTLVPTLKLLTVH